MRVFIVVSLSVAHHPGNVITYHQISHRKSVSHEIAPIDDGANLLRFEENAHGKVHAERKDS